VLKTRKPAAVLNQINAISRPVVAIKILPLSVAVKPSVYRTADLVVAGNHTIPIILIKNAM
jgi:hypothetical protein